MSSLTPSPGAAPRWQFWHFGALGGAEGGSFGPGPAARGSFGVLAPGGGAKGAVLAWGPLQQPYPPMGARKAARASARKAARGGRPQGPRGGCVQGPPGPANALGVHGVYYCRVY